MIKSRLYDVFDALPQREMKELRKFIHSPFFNTRDHVKQLFDYLVITKFEKKRPPTKEAAFDYLFPGKRFDDHKLRLSISLLLKCIEKYLVVNELLNNQTNVHLNLAKAYRKLNLKRHFKKTIAKQNSYNKLLPQNAGYFRQQYLFLEEQYLFNSKESRKGENLRLKEVNDSLDMAYLSSKLKQSCFSLTNQAIYKKEFSFGMVDEVIRYVEQKSFLEAPAIEVYYLAYKSLSNPSDYSIFKRFKASIIENQNHFSEIELRDLFLLACNYCIHQINRGERKFAIEGLDLYKVSLVSEVLIVDGILSRFTYENIVFMAILRKEYIWAIDFMYEYKDKLEKEHEEASFVFNLARLEFERQNYDAALELINKTHFPDVFSNLSVKAIEMKIYFELSAFDLLYAHLEAMKIFIHRNKTIGFRRKHYLNAIKFIKKILSTPKEDSLAIHKIYNNIQLEETLVEKAWLLKQVE